MENTKMSGCQPPCMPDDESVKPSWLSASVRWLVVEAIDFARTGVEFYGWVFRSMTGIGVRFDD